MKNITKVITISRPLYWLIATIAILIVLGAVISLIQPIISKYIVDDIVSHLQHKSNNFNDLVFLIALSFVLGLIAAVLNSLSDRLGDHFSGKLRQFLTERFYNKVLTLPQSYFDSEISGKIVNQLNRGIFTLQQFMNTSTNFILPTFLQTIFTIVVLAYYSLPIAFLTFLLFPIYLALSLYSTKKWGIEEEKKNKLEDHMRGRMGEVIANIKLVKSFTNEHYEYSFASDTLTASNKIYARQSTMFHLVDFIRTTSLLIVFTLISIIAFVETFRGGLSVGSLVLILQLIVQVQRPLFSMSFILTQLQTAESGSKEFFSILDLPSVEHFAKKRNIEKLSSPAIRFEDVSFSYDQENTVLNHVSFEMGAKETVALVGHSGAGKSTIINMILKFYLPSSGHIYIDDKKYDDLTHSFIRENISLVFQENELFSTTIKENVAYGAEKEASDKEVEKALRLANAWDFVSRFPKGIYEQVGERGVKLSGGQKQRIQIARAMMKNAPILILDEATSSLDAKSEKEVQEALEHLMQDKLVIIIAHRFSTIQNVHKVIVIDNGTVVDCGSPQTLANKKGIYHDLLSYQVEGNKKLLANFDITS